MHATSLNAFVNRRCLKHADHDVFPAPSLGVDFDSTSALAQAPHGMLGVRPFHFLCSFSPHLVLAQPVHIALTRSAYSNSEWRRNCPIEGCENNNAEFSPLASPSARHRHSRCLWLRLGTENCAREAPYGGNVNQKQKLGGKGPGNTLKQERITTITTIAVKKTTTTIKHTRTKKRKRKLRVNGSAPASSLICA